MAKRERERERFTERTRPHRRGTTPWVGGPAGADSWRNPVVLVAAGGLLLAVILAAGFLLGSRGATPQTAELPEATLAADAAPSGADAAASATLAADSGANPTIAPPPAPAGPQYDAPEDQALDAENLAYFATIETPRGTIVAELWPELAPETVNSFVFLARQGYYDGLTFHRVEPEFVIQGGDPAGNGSGGPGYSLPGEFNSDDPVPHRLGTLAMARTSDPNSAGSQFYIVTQDSASASGLDGQYTVFGHVIQGMDAVHAMQVGDVMSSVTIEEKPIAERVVSPDDIRDGKLPENDGGAADGG